MSDQPVILGEAEIAARKRRNLWIAVGLVGFIALVFVITIVHLGGNVAKRPF
jgi:uncharacterized membrane protein